MNPVSWLKERVRERRHARDDERDIREGFWSKLRRHLGRLPFATNLVAAYLAAFDPKTPASAKAILVAALAYFVIPADLVPDVLIGAGFLDDATVICYALATARKHVLPVHYERVRRALSKTEQHNALTGTAAWQEAGV